MTSRTWSRIHTKTSFLCSTRHCRTFGRGTSLCSEVIRRFQIELESKCLYYMYIVTRPLGARKKTHMEHMTKICQLLWRPTYLPPRALSKYQQLPQGAGVVGRSFDFTRKHQPRTLIAVLPPPRQRGAAAVSRCQYDGVTPRKTFSAVGGYTGRLSQRGDTTGIPRRDAGVMQVMQV